MLKPHIVILGAGFGGTYIAKRLAKYVRQGKIDITIVNRTNYFLFTPLLHEVATGSLTPTSVAEPLREIFVGSGIRIAQGSVQIIDAKNKLIKLTEHKHINPINYDYLIIATGADTNYYNIIGAEKFSYPLKSLLDAARIRSRIIDSFEEAVLTDDPIKRARLLSFVVVGGGATGVETAAELAEFVSKIVKRYYGATRDCLPGDHRFCKAEEPKISLIHTGSELLQTFKSSLRKAAEKRLKDSGVEVHLNCTVTEVSAENITMANGDKIQTALVIWSAGVKANIPHFENESPSLMGGRLIVDEFFRVGTSQDIFAVGDVAGYVDRDELAQDPTKTRPLPLLAQVAEASATIVAKNLIATIRKQKLVKFHYQSKGSMVSVGQWFALGEIFSFHIAGRLTWWLWRTVYLFKFASWKKRIRIAFEWTLEIFYPRDITKLT